MAFAASDIHSFAQGMTRYLSVEYAHYKAALRRKPLNPNRGVSMSLMIDAVREDGPTARGRLALFAGYSVSTIGLGASE